MNKQAIIKIYRLENKLKQEPFFGEQKAVRFLEHHKNPEDMLNDIRLTIKQFNKLMNDNYLFGWTSLDLYKNFFKTNKKINGEKECQKLGFNKQEYLSENYIIFPDGQIIFKPLN